MSACGSLPWCLLDATPQPHLFNNGRWKELERMERDEALRYGVIVVFVGSLDAGYMHIGRDKVGVPRYMFKVIYHPGDKKYRCYVFPNSAKAVGPVESYRVGMGAFGKSSGLTFKAGRVSGSFIKKAVVVE